MAEHYTKSTVEVRHYCKKCTAFTMHNVQGGLLSACQGCLQRLKDEAEVAKKKPPASVQTSLFGN